MYVALRFNFSRKSLWQINLCRLYLQVLAISDIVSADGISLLPTTVKGERAFHLASRLYWPQQQRPPAAAWAQWNLFLSHISTRGRLHQCLGDWVHYDQASKTWQGYQPMLPQCSSRCTRQTKVWYQLGTGQHMVPEARELVPVTLIYDKQQEPTKFYTASSTSSLPQATAPPPNDSIWELDSSWHAFADTPAFYQRLIGPFYLTTDQADLSIAHGIELETLAACSDGSYDPITKQGSHGWLFANEGQDPILQGAGPDDCHSLLMSSYRSELGSLIAVLYVIYRICMHHSVTSGKVKYYCDNKGVITNEFHKTVPGISPFLTTDYDLVCMAKTLLQMIPITVAAEWVKGHYKGSNKEFKHEVNSKADHLASKFLLCPPPGF
jgi:hypothetical protein